MCKATDTNSVCCLPRMLAFWSLLSEFWAVSLRFSLPGLQVVEAMVLRNFQCRGVLPFWIIVGALSLQ